MKYLFNHVQSFFWRLKIAQLLKAYNPTLKFFLFFVVTLINFFQEVSANNIVVSNVSLTGQNMSAGTNSISNFVNIKFNLSWENSWRTATGPSNCDTSWFYGASDARVFDFSRAVQTDTYGDIDYGFRNVSNAQ